MPELHAVFYQKQIVNYKKKSIGFKRNTTVKEIEEISLRYWLSSLVCEWCKATTYGDTFDLRIQIDIQVKSGDKNFYYTQDQVSEKKLRELKAEAGFRFNGYCYLLKPCDKTMTPLPNIPFPSPPVNFTLNALNALNTIEYKLIPKIYSPIIYTGMTN